VAALVFSQCISKLRITLKIKRNPQAIATIDDLIEDIEYVVQLVGIDHVALGGDWINEIKEGMRKQWHLDNSQYLSDARFNARHGSAQLQR
jgi:microsomal dipeptidase-like Zn-dependent dipeptidase